VHARVECESRLHLNPDPSHETKARRMGHPENPVRAARRGGFCGGLISTPIFDDPPDEPPGLPNRGSDRPEQVVQPTRLYRPEPGQQSSGLFLVVIQEIVIVPVKRLHRYGLSSQSTAAVLAMQAMRWLRGAGSGEAGRKQLEDTRQRRRER
jgi:hypothetical protein